MLLPLLVACGPKAPPVPAAAEIAPAGGPFEAPIGRDHPLVGRIWAAPGRFVTEAELVADLAAADHVLLGEKHDNPDAHRLQGWLVGQLSPRAVAFEMLDHADPVEGAVDAASLAAAVAWDESGWPEFALYEPVFSAAYAVGAAVVAAHPTRDEVKAVMKDGFEALPDEIREGLPLDRTLPEDEQRELEAEIEASHCGHATPELVEKMVCAQVLKDAWMARSLVRAGPRSALVAGNGHTRTDRGVPHYLDGTVRTVSFVEVRDGATDPGAYDEAADYAWFVPRADDDDPCAAFAAPPR